MVQTNILKWQTPVGCFFFGLQQNKEMDCNKVGPLFARSVQMALSAASPFYRGYVSDIDCRWGVISASVDDRTPEERGLKVSCRNLSVFIG